MNKPELAFDWTRASLTALSALGCFYFAMTGNWQALLAGISSTYWMSRAFKAESIQFLMAVHLWNLRGGNSTDEKAP